MLCCACVHTNPEEAVTHLVEPTLFSVISSLKGIPVTGFGGRGILDLSLPSKVLSLVVGIILVLICCKNSHHKSEIDFFPGETLNFSSSGNIN